MKTLRRSLRSKKGVVPTGAIVSGVVSLILLGTLVVFGTIFMNKMADTQATSGTSNGVNDNSTTYQTAKNATVEIGKIASDWFPLLVLAIVILSLLIGVITALGFVQGQIGRN